MTIAYVTFVKHAQKVTKTAPASRPVLKGVHHAEGGTLVVTDSHRLYLAKNAHANTSGEIVDPKTGGVIDGNYPDVSRLVPESSDAKYVVKLDIQPAINAFAALIKSAQVLDRKEIPIVSAKITDDSAIVFEVKNNAMKSEYKAPQLIEGHGDEMKFNAQYFADALAMFKDVSAQEVVMRYYGSQRPFTLTHGTNDELLALLLPTRTNY